MTTALEAAFPLNSNWPAATVRSKLAEAMIAVFDTPDLSGEDFAIQPYAAIAVAGPGGDLTFYAYDAADTTTADDGGISCIVVSGRRYIRSGEVIVRDAATSAVVSAQPASPTFGDTYIVPPAPSGDDWAGQAKTVATYTARGWMFRQPFVGMIVYVEDEDGLYHYDSAGNWRAGLPIGAIADRSIPVTKLDDPFAIIKVEDVRNAPPGSPPTAGTSYIVGTAPTGAFAGHVGEVARWTGGAWTFLAPVEGDTVYRRDAGTLYSSKSGAWAEAIPQSPVIAFYDEGLTPKSANVSNTATPIPVSTIHGVTGKPGQYVRVVIAARSLTYSHTGTGDISFDLRLFHDTESVPLAMIAFPDTPELTSHTVIVPIIDTSPHDYTVSIVRDSVSGSIVNLTGSGGVAFYAEVVQPS